MNKRLSALIAAGATAAAVLGLAAPAHATAGTANVYSDISADWLAGELSPTALLHNSQYSFDDYGLTIDAGFALHAAGKESAAVAAIRAAIVKNESNYTTGAGWGYPGDISAGATGKAAAFEQLDGGTASAALITRLEGRVDTATGQVHDGVDVHDSFGGDYANVFSQAWAAQALAAAGSSKATSVTTFLRDQQCSAGFFRQNLSATACGGTDKPDVDSTAQAILSLLPQQSQPAVATAISTAVAWLISVQQADGSFTETSAAGAGSTNSTGLAGYALGQAGSVIAAGKAAAFVKSLEVTPAIECAHPSLAGDFGAIAKDAAALTAAEGSGIAVSTEDGFRRASAPGIEALTYLSPAPTSTVAKIYGTSAYLKGGSKVNLTIGGLTSGESACFYGDTVAPRAAANGVTSLTLPSRTGVATYVLDHMGPQTGINLNVLGRATFSMQVSSTTPAAGATEVVRAWKLAPGEAWSLYARGTKVASGRASSTGAIKAVFRIAGPAGKALITLKGQFSDIRHAYATIAVR